MTDHVLRLYALATTVLAFFVTWAVIAARPWIEPAPAPAAASVQLAAYEQQLRRTVALADLLARARSARAVASPVPVAIQSASTAPRVVSLAALAVTRTS